MKLRKLAALPFPAHPSHLRRVPQPPTMKQEEQPRAGRRVPAVQLRDPGESDLKYVVIVWQVLGRRVRPVREQCEPQGGIRVGQEMNLQPLDEPPGAVRAVEQRRNDDDRRAIGWYAFGKIEFRQRPRRNEPRDEMVNDTDRDLE